MSPRLASALVSLLFAGSGCAAPSGKEPPIGAHTGPAPAPAVRSVALPNAGFENAPRPEERCPERWDCTMHADPDAFRFELDTASAAEGRQSVCIDRVKPEPWALISRSVPDPGLKGARIRLSVALRIDRPEGEATGVGPWIFVHGPHGRLGHDERVVKEAGGWQRVSVEMAVPETARLVEVGAIMYGGGRVCLDDARLEVLP